MRELPPRECVQQKRTGDDYGSDAEDEHGRRTTILRHPDLRMLLGMKAIRELFERRIEELRPEYGDGRQCHESPPERRRTQPDQRRKCARCGDRVSAEAALGAQCVRNAGKGKP